MQPRHHQAVFQESKLHVLPPEGGLSVVLFPVALDFFEHLRMEVKATTLHDEIERLAVIEVVGELLCVRMPGKARRFTSPRSQSRRSLRCVTSSLPPTSRTRWEAGEKRYRRIASIKSTSRSVRRRYWVRVGGAREWMRNDRSK